jgi:hypothetical protein
MQYWVDQKVSVPAADDPILLKGKDSMRALKGANAGGLLDYTRVEVQQGRSASVQLWAQGLPWALVDEAPHVNTHLVEFHKGVAK